MKNKSLWTLLDGKLFDLMEHDHGKTHRQHFQSIFVETMGEHGS